MNITFYSLSDYNNGTLISRTFDLNDYPMYDELSDARTEWLEELTEEMDDGETREEYIVADYEGIPSDLVGEWDIDRGYGDYIEAIEEHGKEVVDAAVSLDIPYDKISDAYAGSAESDEDFAEEWVESTGLLAEVPEHIKNYFDMEAYARDLMHDYNDADGHYFHANW